MCARWKGVWVAGYEVNIAALGKLISNLESATEQITNANKTLAAQSTLGMLGNPTLSKSGQDFEDTWEYGIEKLGDAAEGVTERLAEAKKNYQELEEANAEIFSGPGNGSGGSPPRNWPPSQGSGHGGSEFPPLITDENRPPSMDMPASQQNPAGGGWTGGISRSISDALGGDQ
ncbi:MAG: hypothetical protein GEU98_06965 [Pseudonocardiaceae bacterium]|nr:hypothetical protein [Pseudonocardiaceae bacterium]